MDILNWIYLKTSELIRTKANNADTDLIAVGADVTFAKRGDSYQTYAMPLKDLVQAGCEANTGFYELDIATSVVVTVDKPRGIVEIVNMATGPGLSPLPAFASTTPFYINNPALDLTVANRDNIYVQYSVYYSRANSDTAIPYLLSTGFVVPNGIGFNLYNANPALADTNNWEGALYVYYELYEK